MVKAALSVPVLDYLPEDLSKYDTLITATAIRRMVIDSANKNGGQSSRVKLDIDAIRIAIGTTGQRQSATNAINLFTVSISYPSFSRESCVSGRSNPNFFAR